MVDPSTPELPEKKLTNLHRVEKYYAEIAPRYDAEYEENNWRLYDELTWYFVEPYLPFNPDDPQTRILDVGGGTAKWALQLALRGYHVLCGDISSAMLTVAQEKIHSLHLEAYIELKELDIRRMPEIPSEGFNLVLALGDVISYAIDDDLAVAELFRVCKPGAYCIASVDNAFIYILNHMKYAQFERIPALLETGISSFFTPHPIRVYFPEQLEQLFQRNGFQVKQLIGKPVITSTMRRGVRERKLNEYYDQILALEKRFCAHPNYVGHGGHLQITVQRPK